MKTTKHYYAMTDSFTGDDPKEPTHGFANTKAPLAFSSKSSRDEWVKNTNLLTAKPITRSEALSMTQWETGDYHGRRYDMVKAVRLYDSGKDYPVSVVLAGKNY